MESEYYIPGVCNIGAKGAARRREAGIAAAILAVGLYVGLCLLHFPIWYRAFVFFPVAGATISLLQAQLHFCVAYGFAGMKELAKATATTDTAEQAEFRRLDRIKAAKITICGIFAGAMAAWLACFL